MALAKLLGFTAVIVNSALGFLVLMRAPRKAVNQCFSLLLFLFFIWSCAELALIYIGTPTIPAHFIEKEVYGRAALYVLFSSMFLLAPVFTVFTALFPRRLEQAWQLSSLGAKIAVFVPAIVLTLLLWSGKVIALVEPADGGFVISLGRYEYPVKIALVAYLLLAMRTLQLAGTNIENEFQERRLRYTFAAFILPAAAGSMFIALSRIYLTGTTMYPYGLFPLLTIIMAVILSYAMLRYKLMEIDFFFSIGLVYTILTAALAGALELLENCLQNVLDISGGIATVISTLFIAGVFSPLKDLVVKCVDSLFGRRSFDTLGVIRHILTAMRHASTFEGVLDALLRELHPVLLFSEAALIMENGLVRTWPPGGRPVSGTLPQEWPPTEEIDALLEAAAETPNMPTHIFRNWRERGFHWAFQIKRENSIVGAFLLAPKPGKLPYTDQEYALVSGLCQEVIPILDTLTLIENLLKHDRAAKELEWAEHLYSELGRIPPECSTGIYHIILYSSLSKEMKGDLIVFESETTPPFLAVCDAFHQGIAAAVTLYIAVAALRAAPSEKRLQAIHENLKRFSSPPLGVALTLLEFAGSNIEISLAGNPAPKFLSGGSPMPAIETTGKPLGLSNESPLKEMHCAKVDLKDDDLLLIATNGLEKALSATKAVSLDNFLSGAAGSNGKHLHSLLQNALAELGDLTAFSDDISYAIVERSQ